LLTKIGFYLFMEQSKVYKLVISFLFFAQIIFAQVEVTGLVIDKKTKKPLVGVEVYSKAQAKTVFTDELGRFKISLEDESQELVFISYGYKITEKIIIPTEMKTFSVALELLAQKLTEIIINQQRNEVFGIKRLKNVEGTAIYAGKKTEVVLVDQLVTNKASGNPRQAYAQVAGLNIYETEDAGLQLNIGGRGLDPNRSANFNTRQNGYDISADVLGYPESYYTPSLEALDEIQIVRGAASLQYGTQFGGLVNFKLKQPNPTKEIEWISRQGIGSFGLFNSFNSLSGTIDKFSYYTYFQYKKGDGFRPNSSFDSKNFYANIGYQISENTKITFENTYLTYLAQQAGGLTDKQFKKNPIFSNRSRNFFNVDWLLLNLKLEHDFSRKVKASLNVFTLDASRKALGFRDRRPSVADNAENPRELLVDDFNNWGAEARVLTRYNLLGKRAIFLLGAKYYQSANQSQQGIGANGIEKNFTFQNERFPNSLQTESTFDFPNLNLSLFGEHIFNLTEQLSLTPGFRFEHINTRSEGAFIRKFQTNSNLVDGRGLISDNRDNKRNFLLFGLGISYKPLKVFEAFGNFSQNYRSVTFNDIRVDSPNLIIDENITDESGYTVDVGIRGELDAILRYDISAFSLLYDNRIGEALRTDNLKVFRTNIGKAQIFGLESLITANISNWVFPENKKIHWQHFLNTAYTTSEYTESFLPADSFRENEIVGNEVEFIPKVNIKTGIELGYQNFKSSFQYTYISTQFSEARNTPLSNLTGGVFGEIPSYSIVDFSAEYTYKKWKLEAGVNNVLDEAYFTRRATGYPGPGIIPSAPRNFYALLQFKF